MVRTAYRFRDFVLQPSRRLLLHRGEAITMTGKVFDTLCVLVRSNGAIVSKDQLMLEVWPDRIVSEGNLTQNVSVLRKILMEHVPDDNIIATHAGRGYQFLLEVEILDDSAGDVVLPLAEPQDLPTPKGAHLSPPVESTTQQDTSNESHAQTPNPGANTNPPAAEIAANSSAPDGSTSASSVMRIWDSVLNMFSSLRSDSTYSRSLKIVAVTLFVSVLISLGITPLITSWVNPRAYRPFPDRITTLRQSSIPITTLSLSPNGAYLAVISGPDDDHISTLEIIDTKSNYSKPIPIPGFRIHSPAWSPDSTEISAISASGEKTTIYKYNLGSHNTVAVADLSDDDSQFPRRLAWSPLGNTMYVSTRVNADGPLRIVEISIDGKKVRDISAPPSKAYGDANPKISPDSTNISYIRLLQDLTTVVCVVSIEELNERCSAPIVRILFDYEWISDTELIYTASHASDTGIFRLNTAGTMVSSEEPFEASDLLLPTHLAFSKDKKELYFTDYRRDVDIVSADFEDGSAKCSDSLPMLDSKALIKWTSRDFQPNISPNGDVLVFLSDQHRLFELWAINLADNSVVKLAPEGIQPMSSSWFGSKPVLLYQTFRDDSLYLLNFTNFPLYETIKTNIRMSMAQAGSELDYIFGSVDDTVVSVDKRSGDETKWITGDIYRFRSNVDENGLFVSFNDSRRDVYFIDVPGGRCRKVITDLPPGCSKCWALSKGRLFYFQETNSEKIKTYKLCSHDLDDITEKVCHGTVEIGNVPAGLQSLSVDPSHKRIYFSKLEPSSSRLRVWKGLRF
jgi:DNA-binding winged helix-turn-helix (wHTH) protein/Tol biopolymer transport system component